MQSIAAPISGDYDAKGESLKTLRHFHNGDYIKEGKYLSNYTFAFHFIFPILGILLAANLLHHLIENNELILLRGDDFTVDETHSFKNLKISTVNMTIYVLLICCFLFVIYVITLDCVGVNKRVFFVQEEIYHPNAKDGRNESVMPLVLEYSIPCLMLAEDLLVFILMILMCVRRLWSNDFKFQCCCSNVTCKWLFGSKKKWYNIIMGPISCLLIHSYHILVGFIHTPHHATSMLIFYGLIIVTFIWTLKAAYYNFFKLYLQWFKSNNDSMCNCICKELRCCEFEVVQQAAVPPVVVQQAAVPPVVVQQAAVDSDDNNKNGVHICALVLISFLSIFTGLVFVYIAVLFILVPINNVIDEAPERILSIDHTIVILFGAAITYKIYQDRKFKTFLDYLVRAATKMVSTENEIKDGHFKDITEDVWKKMSRNERRKKVAYVALSAMYETAKK